MVQINLMQWSSGFSEKLRTLKTFFMRPNINYIDYLVARRIPGLCWDSPFRIRRPRLEIRRIFQRIAIPVFLIPPMSLVGDLHGSPLGSSHLDPFQNSQMGKDNSLLSDHRRKSVRFTRDCCLFYIISCQLLYFSIGFFFASDPSSIVHLCVSHILLKIFRALCD